MVVTFQVLVNDPLSGSITEITNTAYLETDQESQLEASVTDDVVELGVVVEYDNAGFDLPGATVTYFHEVVNTGSTDDSYAITLHSELDWLVELIDPSTGAVIATDSSGDGNSLWDNGVTINTGTLAPGEAAQYQLRVTIPGGAGDGVSESTSLIATSERVASVFAQATDETYTVTALEPVILLPDNSGVAGIGGTAIYSHRILNNTGVSDTFDLSGWSENGWGFTFYWDTDGNGIYTDGVDVAITNTLQLADGASQLFFVVVDVPGSGVADNTVDVVHIGAVSRNNVWNDAEQKWDVYNSSSATDTTTVTPPTILDLSGGGTRTVLGGGIGVFPGTIRNLTGLEDTYNLSISEAWFNGFDAFDHPTELWVDTTGNGVPDTKIATDDEGDGAWDTVVDTDGDLDGLPDITVAAGNEVAYLLRRAVDPLQNSMRDPVTVTATATNTADEDSITATVLLAAATAAVLSDFDAFAANGQVVVKWRTSAELGTVGFDLWRLKNGESDYHRVNGSLVPGLRHIQGGTYRLVDHDASVGQSVVYILHEYDVWGTGKTFGPFEVKIAEREANAKVANALAYGVAREVNRSSVRVATLKSVDTGGAPSGKLKVMVREDGLVRLSAEALASAMGSDPAEVSEWIATGNLWIGTGSDAGPVDSTIFADGFESSDTGRWGAGDETPDEEDGVAWMALENNAGLIFWGEAVDSLYTRDNVYWLGVGPGLRMKTRSAAVVQTKSLGSFPEALHFEEDQWPLTSVMTDPETDFWMWDYFFPYDDETSVARDFSLAVPGVAPSDGTARLVVHLQGSYMADVQENHVVALHLNGNDLGGPWSWTGHDRLSLEVDFPQALLNDGENTVRVTATLVEGLDFDEFYLDAFDLSYQRLHVADGDRLRATSGGAPSVTVTGFSSDEILVFDLANPRRPALLTGVLVEAVVGGSSANFAVAGGLMPFVATASEAVQGPAAMIADMSSQLGDPENQGRYVIVAGPGMEAEAEALAAYRAGQGLSTVVARVDDIYDEFSGGVRTPWAIRDFLRYASDNWADPPQYVFLAGDGTLDYKDVGGDGENLIPAPMTVADGGLVPSDNLLADWLGDDGVPEVAIGRLPAQSAAELAIYREKIIAFEAGSGDWKRRALWLADAVDEGGEFPEDLQTLVNDMPAGYTNERIAVDWLGADEARSRTLQSWDNGAFMVHFLGHGALDFIANSGVVTTSDVASMVNGERAPVLAALTCMVGRFDIPDYDILSEALLLKDAGGSVGVWSPSAFSMNEDAALLGRYQIEALADAQHETIGETVRAALTAYVAGGLGDPNTPRIFIYLGDPAVRVDW